MVAQTRAGGQPAPRRLKFHDKLVGKGLATDALQKKLKALHSELAEMDQENVDVSSLAGVRKELISTSILMHKDRGVKAYAACCLADLLRLYAPDAPYTHNELRDIFQFFFRQLVNGLKGTDAPYYNEYFHLLESLSTVKSVVLVCDLPNADELMTEIFRDLFGMVRRELAKKIELFLADILIAIIDECHSLPSDMLESIMAQFMDKNTKMDQPAYRLAVQVCNATSDKLQRHVCQYFTDIIVSHSRDEEFEEVRTAHELIKQLNRSCPSLLHNVVPQLEEELRVEETQIRIMATQVLGEMFADKGGADFVRKYPTTWNVWLLRKNDKSAAVRLAFVEAAKGVLVNLSEQREAVEEALHTKLFDPDEKIRAAVCKMYSQLDYETALHHVTEKQLRAVSGRGMDKKHGVRHEAMNAVGRLYSLAYPEIENNDPLAIAQFAWIPQDILHMVAATLEVKSVAEQVLCDYILPFPTPPASSSSKGSDVDEAAWTDRLLSVMRYLDEPAVNTLLSLSGLKGMTRPITERYLQCCIDHNGGIIDDDEAKIVAKLELSIKRVAGTLPDTQKSAEDLNAFARLNENRLYKLLKTCMDTQVDLKSLVKSTNEFLRRLEQSSSSLVPTFAIFLRRASLRIVNQSSIPTLIKRVAKGDSSGDGTSSSTADLTSHNARLWLKYISKHCPALFKLHIGELTKSIADERNNRLVEICLQALAAVAGWDSQLAPTDKRTIDRVSRLATSADRRHAKFAARLIASSTEYEETCNGIVDFVAEGLPEADPDLLISHIAVLAQLALRAPDAFERKSEELITFLIRQVLLKPDESDEMDTDAEWVEDVDMLPSLHAKLLALKVCRNRCLAHASSDTAIEIAKPVLKMFTSLIAYNGSFTADAADSLKTKARLRLQAAISLLHLSSVDKYASEISAHFAPLAITIQDPCYQVRMAFADKLVTLLSTRKLPEQFNVVPFLSVHDPEADVKNRTKSYVVMALRSIPSEIRLHQFELIFIRLLHLLAHHPDFIVDEENLPDIAQYIEFYLDLVASVDNISLLYHLAMKAKTVRDAESHAYSENLYAASELAQHLIKAHAKAHGWSLESYPRKVRLPGDILRPLPNAEAANEIVRTVYLPENALTWLGEQGKEKARAERRPMNKRKAVPSQKPNGATKRPRTSTGSNSKRRRAARDDTEEDESSSSPSEEDDGEDDESEAVEEHASAAPSNPQSGSEDEPDDGDNEEEAVGKRARLGRGARTRAEAKIKAQVGKKNAKRRPS